MINPMLIEGALSKRRLKKIMKYLTDPKTEYFNGKETAKGLARIVKSNWSLNREQTVDGINAQDFLDNIYNWAIVSNNNFNNKFSLKFPLIPKHNLIQMYSESSKSQYGWHVDFSITNEHSADYKKDEFTYTSNTHAISLVLNDDYEGGEIEIKALDGGTEIYKPKAGSLVIFPTTHLHRVLPVTKGKRFVFVQWINYKCTNYENWLLFKAFKNVNTIANERVNFNSWDHDIEQIQVEDIMKEYHESVSSGRVNESEWYLGLIRSLWVLKNMISKRCQK